jgi:selenocysteine lyase/cysteine desulfurase
LEDLFAFQVQSGIHEPPSKFETGNQKAEGIAGLLGSIEYLEWLGDNYGQESIDTYSEIYQGRALKLKQAMHAIKSYESQLNMTMLEVMKSIPGVKIYGLTQDGTHHDRIPVFAFEKEGLSPKGIERSMLDAGIKVWSGHFHASEITKRLNKKDGLVRASAAHYNTPDEICRFGEVLRTL